MGNYLSNSERNELLYSHWKEHETILETAEVTNIQVDSWILFSQIRQIRRER